MKKKEEKEEKKREGKHRRRKNIPSGLLNHTNSEFPIHILQPSHDRSLII
jgi:hypothetical protein